MIPTDWFNGPSLLDSGGRYSALPGRALIANELVDVYRNLNRPHSFSIKPRQGPHKALVSGYGRSVVICSPMLVVGEKARQRVIQEGRKNVHSYVRGNLVNIFEGDLLPAQSKACIRISYSPYYGASFFHLERDDSGRPVPESIRPVPPSLLENVALAVINGADVFLVQR